MADTLTPDSPARGPRGEVPAPGADRARDARSERVERAAGEAHGALMERLIGGVPARIMRPRLVFIACVALLTIFGVVMVYSASSVEALKENGSSTYFLVRQLVFALVGTLAAVFIAKSRLFSLETLATHFAPMLSWPLLGALAFVKLFGTNVGGAKRWIAIGGITLQPSEFAKPLIIVLMAWAMYRYYQRRDMDGKAFAKYTLWYAVFFIALIAVEPDSGTPILLAATLVAMALLCGMPFKWLGVGGIVAVVGMAFWVAIAPYRLVRFQVMLDPWSDAYGNGYQATLAIMSFASGGIFGRGLGNSTMKYNFLPEAHNDYILAIIGEELGLVGMLALFLVFAVMVVAAFRIARQAPTLYGKLVASGCATALAVQALINALGVLSVAPMTGKPLPFISYGGSSILASLIMAGLIVRVSVESRDGNPHSARRGAFAVLGRLGAGAAGGRAAASDAAGAPSTADDVSSHLGRSTAGQPTRRSAARSRGFSVYDGGASGPARADEGAPDAERTPAPRPSRRGSVPLAGPSGSGYGRVDLNADPTARLRREGVRTRGYEDEDYGSRADARDRDRRGSRHDR